MEDTRLSMRTFASTAAGRLQRWCGHPLVAALLLALLCAALHHRALDSGWHYDDPAHLNFVARYAPWQYFTLPAVMLEQSYAHITPWNAFFYDLGLPFFGLEARGHYLHLLAVLWATAVATWALLRRWLPAGAALAGASLFLLMPATGVVGQLLMTGHYVYGLLFSVLALHAFSAAVRSGRWAPALVAALFYALACLCKELYVPLVGVLLFWPEGGWRRRLRVALPAFAVAAGYAAWRLWLMGGVGGYVRTPANESRNLSLLLEQSGNALSAFWQLAFGTGALGLVALLAALVLVAWGMRRGRRLAPLFMLVCAAVLAFPLVGVMLQQAHFEWVAGRFLLFVGWGLAVLLAWQLPALGRWQAPALLAVALPLAVASHAATESIFASQAVVKAQNGFLATAPAGAAMLTQQSCSIRYPDQMAQAAAALRHQAPTRLVHDLEELQTVSPQQGPAVQTYDESCGCMRPLGAEYGALLDDFAKRLAQGRGRALDVTLALERTPRGRIFRWNVQSPDEGATCLDLRAFIRSFVPPKGEAAFGLDSTLRLDGKMEVRVIRTYPDGARVHSPILELDAEQGSTVAWTAPRARP